MPTNWSTNKQNIVYPHNEILLSNEKELLMHATSSVNIKHITPGERQTMKAGVWERIDG